MRRAASVAYGSGTPSITQTPTSSGARTIAPLNQSWLTVTTIPSASSVAAGGTTMSPYPRTMPSPSSSSPTLELIVRTAWGSPPTTSVMVFWTAT